MSLFNFFKANSASLKSGLELNFSKDFANQDCRCVLQELDLSELTWMDTSAYCHSKKKLKHQSEVMASEYFSPDWQRDLFE